MPQDVSELEHLVPLHHTEAQCIVPLKDHPARAIALQRHTQSACVEPKFHVLLHLLAVEQHLFEMYKQVDK